MNQHKPAEPESGRGNILAVFGDIAQGLVVDAYHRPRARNAAGRDMNIAYNNNKHYQSDADPDDTLLSYSNELRLGIITAAAGHYSPSAGGC
jgi:hypothetical protein